jgi:hypothetical protein
MHGTKIRVARIFNTDEPSAAHAGCPASHGGGEYGCLDSRHSRWSNWRPWPMPCSTCRVRPTWRPGWLPTTDPLPVAGLKELGRDHNPSSAPTPEIPQRAREASPLSRQAPQPEPATKPPAAHKAPHAASPARVAALKAPADPVLDWADRVRVSHYRVVYECQRSERLILVVPISHRREG